MVDGRYRITGRIGTGGMADVYCAHDEHLGRDVALKMLHRRFAQDQEFVERFRREASAAAGLQHPNVVAVYDRGSFDGTWYIAMERVKGRTLKQLISEEAPLDQRRAIDLAQRKLDYSSELLTQGQATARDVVDSQSDLLNARDRYDAARANLQVQVLTLLRDIGTLRLSPDAGSLGRATDLAATNGPAEDNPSQKAGG